MLSVIIPAHNEAQLIGACIRSVLLASRHPALAGEAVQILVVSDSSTDGTACIARSLGVEVLAVDRRNVGAARATGARKALRQGARWLAFTDADTTVAADWLAQQLACNAEVVCGVIGIRDWMGHTDAVRENFATTYQDRDGHRHIHGANLGVAATAYMAAGGFLELASNEDVELVKALVQAKASVAWSAAPRVYTSTRTDSRAPGGFGAALQRISERGAFAEAITVAPELRESAI